MEFKLKSFYKILYLIKANFKINKKIFISFLALCFFFSLFSFIVILASAGGKFIAESKNFSYFSHNGVISDEEPMALSYSVSKVFNVFLFGTPMFVLNIVFISYVSSKNILKDIQDGTIVFWLALNIKKSNIMISKIVFTYIFVFSGWIITFFMGLIIPVGSKDMDYYKFVLLKIFSQLLILVFITTIIIFLNFILLKTENNFGLVIILIILWEAICYFSGLQAKSGAALKSYSLENIIPNALDFHGEEKRYDVDTDIFGGHYAIALGHSPINEAHFWIGFIMVISVTGLINYFVINKIWNKMDLNV